MTLISNKIALKSKEISNYCFFKKKENQMILFLVAGNFEKSNQFLVDYYKIVDYADLQAIIL
ncbi:hypothetical protein FSS13T_03040 [Flavobacterium saliperosum S13]|uniref:Uncharacterized protein n=2 Tax=Flavobacterium saliperosum TaxID=329186 RepID=A0A1G4V561_9FLAO|nr:hypothetical protein FSS13T_03040 [Flavobacterium saliperosum S13]SCX01374.1 hypothetical protein SAMN02927925_00320 [Flavobacterium saliperosum]